MEIKPIQKWLIGGMALICGTVALASPSGPKSATKSAPPKTTGAGVGAPKIKALSPSMLRGISWLANTQHKDGGWSQGEEAQTMRGSTVDNLKDQTDVADTCAAAIALIRTGSTPSKGIYATNVRKAVDYVCAQIEESDKDSLFITKLRGTRVQGKLGQYIDTFMASLLLAEVKNEMGDPKAAKRVAAAFHKVADKIERNQNKDGTWEKDGWAPALSQSVAAKALNRAAQNGFIVSEGTRQKAENYGRTQFDGKGGFGAGGSAGVQLYAGASSLSAMQNSDNTNVRLEKEARDKLKTAKKPEERKAAETTLKRVADNRKDLDSARHAISGKLKDPAFVSGFGSNGGEEFLSYMNIGESMVVKGGNEWEKWNDQITENLVRIQNQDGTWTGHHCITGRTFCTSAALMVLTVDRAARPMSSQMSHR